MQDIHVGRLIDHVHLTVSDLARSRRFYEAALAAVGRRITSESDRHFGSDELWVEQGERVTRGLHLAFQAADRDAVGRFHRAALGAGGTDNGAPGERRYHPGYYGAFVLDPDGNNIEAVHHGPADRSAESVVVKPRMP